ncbi:probable protein phosphatase 2C 69 [Arachis ipaensis]|uniref:probable protein phosphatase 2C 69 n=1 Tax=Arachis ipaensis TaxID=130454 RepID=UPI000A2B0172|nr:probable protein phosphatase 2C 69 [Arachis ipaensis]
MLQRGYAKQVKEVCNMYIHEMELLQIEKKLEDEACRESLRVTNEERKKLKAEAAQIRAPERKIAQQEFREILLFDGHNGTAAAIYAKENLLNNILSAIPSDLNRDEWIAALPRALVAGFVKTDKDFQQKGMTNYFSCSICSILY